MLDYEGNLDRVFQALADPARRGIVERLSRGPASVSELAHPLDMTLAAALQHVQVLERSGVLTSRKVGRTRTCELELAGLDLAAKWIASRRALWERRLDRLDELLRDEATDGSDEAE